MKKIFLILTAALFVCTASLSAQEKKQKLTPEQRLDMVVAKMQKKLMLDDATAAEFAPIYKEYLQAISKCRPNCTRGKDITDEQIKENISKRIDAQQKALDVQEKYYKKLSYILTGRQLQQIFCNNNKNGWNKKSGWNKGNGRNKKNGWNRGNGAKRGMKFNCKNKPCFKMQCDSLGNPLCPRKNACPKAAVNK